MNSPEYALFKMCKEINNVGFKAVETSMTQEAYSKLEPIQKITSNDYVNSILAFFSQENYEEVLIEKAKEVEWSVEEVTKNYKKATATIGFNYKDKIVGSVDLELLKIDNEWKINDLYNFEFDDE